jgi:hypothetical protein
MSPNQYREKHLIKWFYSVEVQGGALGASFIFTKRLKANVAVLQTKKQKKYTSFCFENILIQHILNSK